MTDFVRRRPEASFRAYAIMSVMESVNLNFSLRHTLATLAYRTARALENAPPEFAKFGIGSNPRTPEKILAHMGDLMDWALLLVEGKQKWQDSEPLHWNDEAARFFRTLEALDNGVASAQLELKMTNRLFQGPIADALTHTGQIAMLRRIAGCPIRGENYFVADIAIGVVGADQPAPQKPF